jgi:hypothetical protein
MSLGHRINGCLARDSRESSENHPQLSPGLDVAQSNQPRVLIQSLLVFRHFSHFGVMTLSLFLSLRHFAMSGSDFHKDLHVHEDWPEATFKTFEKSHYPCTVRVFFCGKESVMSESVAMNREQSINRLLNLMMMLPA